MAKTYRIGDKIIDLEQLVAVGDIYNVLSGQLAMDLFFNSNTKVETNFYAGKDELPTYHNSEGDWTEVDSDFWRICTEKRNLLDYEWHQLSRFR